jgi:hypothetical protein
MPSKPGEPVVLSGCKEIAACLGVEPRRVVRLRAAGAPIRAIWSKHGRRYLAEKTALIEWARNRDL